MKLTRSQVSIVISDIVQANIAKLMPQSRVPRQQLFDEHLVDSLTRYQVATEVAVFFCLHETNSETELLEDYGLTAWTDVVMRHLGSHNQRLCFTTSGSTGLPKQVIHNTADLIAEASYWATLLPSGAQFYRTIPAHHLYGFIFTVLLPNHFKHSCTDLRDNLPISYMPTLPSESVLISSPEVMRLWLHANQPLANGPIVITSAAPASVSMSQQLLALGVNRHIHVYGSTETAGIGWRENDEETFKLMPDITDGLERNRRPLPLQDELKFTSPRHFTIQRRLDNAIQINGYNVVVSNVQQKLRTLPGVQEVAVRPVDGPMGTYLKALFVLKPEATQAQLQTLLAQLPEYERPRQWRLADQLPKNELGKVADWE
ncbi:AMP-binding protein [Salinibius halmophilus]|uniref:AMP-binding protein n=1 Tax=Salinibius halmophilus TaxID=1853216 RepID=UPI000E6619A6|nr:AMP-binding protein [Salinibius halmophilus]